MLVAETNRPAKSWRLDKAWSDRFVPEIKRIVGPYLLEESDIYRDQLENTDLIILNARDKTIACRVRRHGYLASFPNQFTIRLHRESGAKTEMEKIMDGLGDWMFYGHSNVSEDGFDAWWIINLDSLRSHMIREKYEQFGTRYRRGTASNGDGTSFIWFDIVSFPSDPPLIIANGESNPF